MISTDLNWLWLQQNTPVLPIFHETQTYNHSNEVYANASYK